MVVVGCVYLHLPTDDLEAEQRDLAAIWLCATGLILTFLTGYHRLLRDQRDLAVVLLHAHQGREECLADRTGVEHPTLPDWCCAGLHVHPTPYRVSGRTPATEVFMTTQQRERDAPA